MQSFAQLQNAPTLEERHEERGFSLRHTLLCGHFIHTVNSDAGNTLWFQDP